MDLSFRLVLRLLGGFDHGVDGVIDAFGSLSGIRLAGVKPGDHAFERHRGDQLCRPIPPRAVRHYRAEMAIGDFHRGQPSVRRLQV
jgi:hypothetical protein